MKEVKQLSEVKQRAGRQEGKLLSLNTTLSRIKGMKEEVPSPWGKVRMGVQSEQTPSCSSNAHSVRKELLSPPWREKRAAFTLAEVLITLGIIGVVAAMTLPTLVQNYKKHVVETRLEKFYSAINIQKFRGIISLKERYYVNSYDS